MLTSILKITQLDVLSVSNILHKMVETINFLLLLRNVGVNVERIIKFILFLYKTNWLNYDISQFDYFLIISSCFYTE